MNVKILAIESSCDDTAAAVIVDGEVASNKVANQEVHKWYGGVVPEIASRAHMEHIVPVVAQALDDAGVSKKEIDAVAFTTGPGLLGSLLVGTSFAKAFGMANNIPLIEVHHMQAHVMAHFAEQPVPQFPFICLTVSGGHTQLVLVKDHLDMGIIGQTRDDAAGEAFDKAGKMMGLPYPSGPEIDRLASKGRSVFSFPEPSIDGLDFSFSGLKTAFLYFLQKQKKADPEFLEHAIEDVCASLQHRIVTILLNKLKKAAMEHGVTELAIAGGVSANSGLRQAFNDMCQKKNWQAYIPAFQYCTDNAAMIGMVGYYKFLKGEFVDQSVTAKARTTF